MSDTEVDIPDTVGECIGPERHRVAVHAPVGKDITVFYVDGVDSICIDDNLALVLGQGGENIAIFHPDRWIFAVWEDG